MSVATPMIAVSRYDYERAIKWLSASAFFGDNSRASATQSQSPVLWPYTIFDQLHSIACSLMRSFSELQR